MEFETLYYILFFFVAIFSGFYGVITGGAGFINIPIMVTMLGLSYPQAVATNVFGAFGLVAVGGYKFYKEGKADVKVALFLAAFSVIGMLVGLQILVNADEILLKRLMAGALFIVMALSFMLSDKSEEKELRKIGDGFRRKWQRFVSAAFVTLPLGIYQSVVSAGYGTFVTYVPVVFLQMKFKDAIGTARLHGVPMTIITSASMAYLGLIDYFVGFVLMAGMGIGSYFGARVALKVNTNRLRIIFAFVVAVNVILLLR